MSFRGAGQREIQNSLALDGINSSSNLLAATSMRPIAEAVTEIQVQTGSTSAEYGSYLGVHINVVTKSGTNSFHGSGFYFGQDDSLDERGYFDNPALPKNPRTRKQYGFQVDGPVVIPGLYDGRNRTFFMGAFEGVRAEGLSSPFASVPTNLMRQGNFSEINAAIRNPFTGQNFPGNIIPPNMISPVSLRILEYYPAANRAGTATNYQGQGSSTDDVDQVLARFDQNLGNKIRLSVRYNWHDSYTSNIGALTVAGVDQPRVNKNTLVSYTHTLTPTLHNDFRIGYHRIDFDTVNPFYVSGPSDAGASLGIPGFDGDVQFDNPGIPSINISNFSGLGGGGTNWFQFDTTFQMAERAVVQPRVAQHSHRIRPSPDGHGTACRKRSARTFRLHGQPHRRPGRFRDGYRDGRLHARTAANRHSSDRSDPGSRRRVAQRILHQRRVAGFARSHVERWAALRNEHGRADL